MVYSFFRLVLFLRLLLALQGTANAQGFPVVSGRSRVMIIYSKEGPALDSIAATLLADDIERATARRPVIATDGCKAKGNVVVIGSITSNLVQRFASPQASFSKKLTGKRECFGWKVVGNPASPDAKALLIAGSDTRGTAYGVFAVSEKLGISPWWWWADVPVRQQKKLTLRLPEFTSAPPSVRYRGIFINDEDWGLRPWAATTFEPEKANIGPKTYAKVFELLLRLKANLLWPAMHPGTTPFFSDPANVKLAAAYGIIVGSSHAEPMLRNNVGEWNEKSMGDFNYLTNRDKVYRYWEDRVKQSSRMEAIYSLGMRGVHDSGMEGVKDAKEAVPLLERIMEEQRDLLRKHIGNDLAAIPQAFTAYKEVLDIYDNGLKLPDDVTLVWPDDNYGYIQRLNAEKEAARSGGSGVYYHASYWGRPHDYLWLSTTHPSLIREEMMKAYENGADRLWVLNLGDIKPLEYNVQLFMDMAYDASPFKESRYTRKHLLRWNERLFGKKEAASVTNILWRYYGLAFERRPEFMGWSQTEPTTKTAYTTYNHFWYGDEAQRRIDAYDSLQRAVVALRKGMKKNNAATFYQTVYYPVVSAALMNKKFLYRDKAYLYGKEGRISAYDYAVLSKAAYDGMNKETDYFNNDLQNGKWKGMMSMKPRDLPVFAEPVLPSINVAHGNGWGIAPEGQDTMTKASASAFTLPDFVSGCKQRFFVDVFLSDSVTVQWTAKSPDDWVVLSAQAGTLLPQRNKTQTRLWVRVDWAKAPKAAEAAAQILITGGGKQQTVRIRALRPAPKDLSNFTGFVETSGYVSIYAQHYTAGADRQGLQWKPEEGLGHTGVAMIAKTSSAKHGLYAIDPARFSQNASVLAYDFYSFTGTAPQVIVSTLPTHPLNTNYSMRYGVSIDDGAVNVVDFKTVGRSEEWKQNVLRNEAVRTIAFPLLKAGRHTLKIYALDPGVILDRILIDFGGLKKAYGAIPETVRSSK